MILSSGAAGRRRTSLIAGLLAAFMGLGDAAWSASKTHEVAVPTAVSGEVSGPVVLRIETSPEGRKTYQVRIGGGWSPGNWVGTGADELHALLIDLDFDGHADLWVTGTTGGQGRERRSDVWRYQPSTGRYQFDHALSFMQNLEVDLTAKVLESGVADCGCAGSCFSYDRFAWTHGSLSKISRRAQDCPKGRVVFREWRRSGQTLQLVRRVSGRPDERTGRARRTGGLRPLDWSRYDETGTAARAGGATR